MAVALRAETLDGLNQLRTDFRLYAQTALKVRAKSGAIQPLVLNRAQEYIDKRLDAQRKSTGKVRALILKGRQQGCSTYVEGRFFWRTVWSEGVRTFILTHEDAATANLFEMAHRFYEHLPDPWKPSANTQNAKELLFKALDSGYKVGTAGNKAVGRSSTIQLFHGSEVAFWPNAEEHAAGVLQTVPDEPDTEIILESTANGIGNYFHKQWQLAERGESAYQAIFVPWYWQTEYVAKVEGFKPTPEEAAYGDTYKLTLPQLAWRRTKIAELGEYKFRQEYPANAIEAFQTSGDDSLIKAEHVMRARKNTEAKGNGPLLVGVDPARFGDDRTSIIRRQGRVASGLESHRKKDTMEVAGMCARILNSEPVARMFIDIGGLGAGIYDRLVELGFSERIEAVNSGEQALEPDKYTNRRAEMWGTMGDWLKATLPVSIPDTDSLHADLMGPHYKFDSNSRLVIERKEDMKKRGLASPDEAEALGLTFAAPVSAELASFNPLKGWVSG